MNKFLSDKIKVISLFSIIFVLYIHSDFHDYPNEIQGMTFNFLLQDVFSVKIGRCAVPLFFAISGFLFFRNLETWNGLWTKMGKRTRTLLVPYLIACLFPAFFYLAMEYIPFCHSFVNGGGGFSQNFSKPVPQFLYFLFIDAGNSTPYAFHLWFLRDLIVIVAFSPVLFLFKRHINLFVLCIILFVAVCVGAPNSPFFGMFWFIFGACAIGRMEKLPLRFIYIIIFLLLCIAETLFKSFIWKYLQLPIVVFGVTGLWLLYDMIVPKSFLLANNRILTILCSYTFFIYLFHEPTLNIVRKLLVIPFGHTSFSFAFSYLLSPWIFAVVWVFVGLVFKKLLPRVYGVLTGGR